MKKIYNIISIIIILIIIRTNGNKLDENSNSEFEFYQYNTGIQYNGPLRFSDENLHPGYCCPKQMKDNLNFNSNQLDNIDFRTIFFQDILNNYRNMNKIIANEYINKIMEEMNKLYILKNLDNSKNITVYMGKYDKNLSHEDIENEILKIMGPGFSLKRYVYTPNEYYIKYMISILETRSYDIFEYIISWD